MLILAHTDGLGVDFDQLSQRILKPPCDGNCTSQVHVKVRKFLCSQRGSGINGSASLIDNGIAGIGVLFQKLHSHGLRLPGSGTVADCDVLNTVTQNHPVQYGDGFLLFALVEGRVDYVSIQNFSGSIHNRHLTAVAVAGVKTHGDEALNGRLHQQGLQVQGKIMDGTLTGTVGQIGVNLPLERGENQTLKGILGCGTDKGRNLHGRFQCSAAHKGSAVISGKLYVYFQNSFLLTAVNGQNLMIQQPGDGGTEVIIESVNGVFLWFFCLADKHCLPIHQFPEGFTDGCIVGKILGNNIGCTSKSLLDGRNTLFFANISNGQSCGILTVLRKNGGCQ